jgi:predicted sulfurtransferase
MNFLMLCQDGSRAEQVTKYIKNNGYKHILYIEGGIDSLLEAVPELKVN